MTETAAADRIHRHGPSFGLLVILLLVLTALRYWGLMVSQVELMFDEAQYWSWSLDPAWGYFSKPPLIAWLIGGENLVCGTSEFCARSFIPAIHFGTALVIYALARRAVSPVVGFWSALVFATLPGIAFSSKLVTTDVPLLFFWAVALYCLWTLRHRRAVGFAILLGVVVGLGLLAKYAMIYVVLCLVIWLVIDAEARRAIWKGGLFIALVIAVLILTPNILWNVDNGLITFLHTADNVDWNGSIIHPGKALEFLGAQFGVFGPVPMALLLAIAVRPRLAEGVPGPAFRFIYAFSVPIVALILFEGLMSRAHANWAAPTYVAASILVTAVMIGRGWRWLLYLTLAIHLVLQGAMILADSQAKTLRFPFGIDFYYRALGFKDLAQAVGQEFNAGQYGAVLTDWRRVTGTLLYNLRSDPPPVVTWPHPVRAYDHYQLTRPLTDKTPEPLLLVTKCNRAARLDAAFDKWQLVDTVITKGGQRYNWIFFLIRAEGPHLGRMPTPDCEDVDGDERTIVDPATLPPIRPD
ncbi:MAG: glycosyltransferase family 39 protein [Rhodobiaceae bacterium]|nr:glycosyltransferase family 39 protein [Rhodobiaceae bacterium]